MAGSQVVSSQQLSFMGDLYMKTTEREKEHERRTEKEAKGQGYAKILQKGDLQSS